MDDGQLSIVIPCKNEEKFIGKTLQSLQEQTAIKPSIPIYIADAGSTDGTLDVIRAFIPHLNIKVVKGGLPPVGRNSGARFCHSKYILFMDADIEFSDQGTINKLLELAEHKQLELVVPYITIIKHGWRDKLFEYLYYWTGKTKIIGAFGGMLILIRNETFTRLGRFNENLPLGDDWELTHQIERSHFQMADISIYTSNRRFAAQGYFSTLYQWFLIALSKDYRNKGHKEYFSIQNQK